MTRLQLQKLENELSRRGYKKYTQNLVGNESWSWIKSFDKSYDDNGEIVAGYQIAFRVWDATKYGEKGANAYSLDFWTSAFGIDGRMDFTSNWEPVCDFDTFEAMARDFNQQTQKYCKQ